ncbi:hypothetical protein GCM10010435_84710 [Winogradskya consettensis]|uniref:Uncharacterized protein n=1 Tax=Winogradskya consettensis TaxID=113560 RepID=A0A919T235_9ACTN|nr:hypothetical protein Aco04nite_79390 [Actinoplanes consettensis]
MPLIADPSDAHRADRHDGYRRVTGGVLHYLRSWIRTPKESSLSVSSVETVAGLRIDRRATAAEIAALTVVLVAARRAAAVNSPGFSAPRRRGCGWACPGRATGACTRDGRCRAPALS